MNLQHIKPETLGGEEVVLNFRRIKYRRRGCLVFDFCKKCVDNILGDNINVHLMIEHAFLRLICRSLSDPTYHHVEKVQKDTNNYHFDTKRECIVVISHPPVLYAQYLHTLEMVPRIVPCTVPILE